MNFSRFSAQPRRRIGSNPAARGTALLALLVLGCSGESPAPAGSAPQAGGSGTAGGAGMSSVSGGASGSGGVASGGADNSGGAGSAGTGAGSAGAAGEGCREFVMPADCTIPAGAVLPEELRCTGLYGDWERRALACGVTEYAPAYALWADGAEKRRYVWLPPGQKVDVTDANDFRYPLGTQFWKEFIISGTSGKQIGETRLLRRVEAGWMYTTYVWDQAGSNAVQMNEGVDRLLGSQHTVPSREQCKECHAGRRDYVLGWDALMLGEGASGLTRESLVARDLVTWKDKESGAPSPMTLTIPGDAVEKAALGYLHANCGISCHNDTPRALAQESGFFTRLEHGALGSVLQTSAWVTGFERPPSPNAPLSMLPPPPGGGTYVDLRPLDLERSLILVRMRRRNEDAAMPRQGTTQIDPEGIGLIERWVSQMTPERGYPSAK